MEVYVLAVVLSLAFGFAGSLVSFAIIDKWYGGNWK